MDFWALPTATSRFDPRSPNSIESGCAHEVRHAYAILALSVASTVFAFRPAAAAPISDPTPWLENLEQLARTNSFPAIVKAIKEVAAPNLELATLPGQMDEVAAYFGKQTVRELEELPGRTIGTIVKLNRFAVVYDENIMFYSFTFMRTGKGWVLASFSTQSNLGKVVPEAWPL